jgi:methylthioribose-1-phosphate isomerase
MRSKPFQALQLFEDHVLLLDQTLLPHQESYLKITQVKDLVGAIQNLSVRGAPLLGLAGLYGLYLAALSCRSLEELDAMVFELSHARPTAIQLSSCIQSSYHKYRHLPIEKQRVIYFAEARNYEKQISEESENIAKQGQKVLPDGSRILTHCNTGSLAMSGWGTALGIILYGACVLKKHFQVYYTETRPLQQGLRLSSFELDRFGIDATCIADGAAASLMKENKIDLIITGADRISLNGDSANKIGTYMLAICAQFHHIPFYIAAPISTIDFDAQSGQDFVIELREAKEFWQCASEKKNPPGYFKASNPAFDVSPGELISGYITEKGLIQAPFHHLK